MLLINGICNDFALGVPFAASPMEYAIAVHGYTFHMSILIPVAMRADLSTFSIEAVTCLLAVVDAMPDGLDTWVGESARFLSAGEARRLAMARCFLRDGPVWILDEPTEGLDPSTERQLLANIYAKTERKTLLMITHRIVDLQDMDAVVVLKGGRIAAQGPADAIVKDTVLKMI